MSIFCVLEITETLPLKNRISSFWAVCDPVNVSTKQQKYFLNLYILRKKEKKKIWTILLAKIR